MFNLTELDSANFQAKNKAYKNILIDRCLQEATKEFSVRDNLTKAYQSKSGINSLVIKKHGFYFYSLRHDTLYNLDETYPADQIAFMLSLLSATPNGAVMPFLNVPLNLTVYFAQKLRNVNDKEIVVGLMSNMPHTLDEKLYREFSEILRFNKTPLESWELTTNVYLNLI